MRRFWWFLRFIWQFRSSLTLALIFKLLFRAWSTPNTMVAGDVFSASNYNLYVRDNLNYLFSGRPGSVIKRDNGADYTTTSTTFVDIDGTNLTITLTISSGKARVSFVGLVNGNNPLAAHGSAFDFVIDGTRYGSAGADGIASAFVNSTNQTVGYSVVVTGLSVGSHTFRPQWRKLAGTSVLSAGTAANPGGGDAIPIFSVEEIG